MLHIANECHFYMVVGNTAIKMSFCQVVRLIQGAWSLNYQSHFSGLEEKEVSMYVQAVTAINLQQISTFMNDKRCSAYSTSVDFAAYRDDLFINVRLSSFIGGNIENRYLLAIPSTTSHAEALPFEVIQQILDGIMGINWWKKILFLTPDGTANRTGCHRGVGARFQQISLPGFFRFWCADHQLGLALQFERWGVLWESFWDLLVV